MLKKALRLLVVCSGSLDVSVIESKPGEQYFNKNSNKTVIFFFADNFCACMSSAAL
jgi:hypothetical protein